MGDKNREIAEYYKKRKNREHDDELLDRIVGGSRRERKAKAEERKAKRDPKSQTRKPWRRKNTYTVQSGDSWFSIAGNELGDQRYAGELARLNPGFDVLNPGVELVLPEVYKNDEEPLITNEDFERFEDIQAKVDAAKENANEVTTLNSIMNGKQDGVREYDTLQAYIDAQQASESGARETETLGEIGSFGADEGFDVLAYEAEAQAVAEMIQDMSYAPLQDNVEESESTQDVGELAGDEDVASSAKLAALDRDEFISGEETKSESNEVQQIEEELKKLKVLYENKIADAKLKGGDNLEQISYEYDTLVRILKQDAPPWLADFSVSLEEIEALLEGRPLPGQSTHIPVTSTPASPEVASTATPGPIQYGEAENGISVVPLPGDTASDIIERLEFRIPGFYLAPANQIVEASNLESLDVIYAGIPLVFPQILPEVPEEVQWDQNIHTIEVSPITEASFSFLENPNILPPIFKDGDTVGFQGQEVEVKPRSSWAVTDDGNTLEFLLDSSNEGFTAEDPEDRFLIYKGELEENSRAITVHHTGGGDEGEYQSSINLDQWNALNDEEKAYEIQKIYIDHTQVNGWGDIAYHFIIAPDGTIYEGRDLRVRGSHVFGFNTGNIGIVVLGDFRDVPVEGEEKYSSYLDQVDFQMNALEQLTASLGKSLNIDSMGYHNHYNGSDCPGDLASEIDIVHDNLGFKATTEGYRPPGN